MKKEIKTYEELLKCDGMNFEGSYNGYKILGTISIQDKIYFNPCDDSKEHLEFDHFEANFMWMKNNFLRLKEHNFIFNIYVEVEQWQPKFGELVEVSNDNRTWYKRIFVGEYAGRTHCIHKEDERFFEADTCESYSVFKYRFVKQIEEHKVIEISLEEAKDIIAKEKGIKAEQVNLNFKIN